MDESINKDKKQISKKVLIIAGCVLLFIVLAGIIAAWASKPKEDLSTIDGIYDALISRVERTYSNIFSSGRNDWNGEMDPGSAVEVEGQNYLVSSSSVPSISFTGGESYETKTYKKFYFFTTTPTEADSPGRVVAIIDELMLDAGYEKIDLNTYQNDNSECKLTQSEAGDVVTFSCYSEESITALSAESSALAEAFFAANTDLDSSGTVFGPYKIKDETSAQEVYKDSETEGYQIAEAVVTDGDNTYLALFYRKDGDDWQYVAKASDEYGFRCGDFESNQDAREAFYNQVCLSETGHVRLDTDNRALQ